MCVLIKTSKAKGYIFIDLLETIDFELIWVYTLHCSCEVTHNEVWINDDVLKRCHIYCTGIRCDVITPIVCFKWRKCAALNLDYYRLYLSAVSILVIKAIDYSLLTLTCLCSATGILASVPSVLVIWGLSEVLWMPAQISKLRRLFGALWCTF